VVEGISRIMSSYKTVYEGENCLLACNKFYEIDVFTKYGLELIIQGIDLGFNLEIEEGIRMMKGVDARYCGSFLIPGPDYDCNDTCFVVIDGEIYEKDHSEIIKEIDYRVLPIDNNGDTWFTVVENMVTSKDLGEVEASVFENGNRILRRKICFGVHISGMEIEKTGDRYIIEVLSDDGLRLETVIVEVESGEYRVIEDDKIRVVAADMHYDVLDLSNYEELRRIK
jgi:hypothetical protein